MGLVAPLHVETSQTRDWTCVPCTGKRILIHCTTREVLLGSNLDSAIFWVHVCVCAQWLQPCPGLCNSVDCSLPGSSIQGILQAGILKWVAMSSSRGSSLPRNCTCVSYVFCIGRRVLYYQRHLGSQPWASYIDSLYLNSSENGFKFHMLLGRFRWWYS